MKTYSWETIYELLAPLMEVMKKDYPNDAQLVITSNFAKIEYIHTDMKFLRRTSDDEK